MSRDAEFVSTAELLAQELLAENKKLRAERDQFRAELTRMEDENMRLRFPEDQVEMSRENRKLRAQRDKLLAVLRDWVEFHRRLEAATIAAGGRMANEDESPVAVIRRRAREAIANCEEKRDG